MFDEMKEVKYFKEVTDFYRVLQCKILLKNKIFKKKKKKESSKSRGTFGTKESICNGVFL